MRELYIYYRVRSGDSVAAQSAVLALQRSLRAETRGLETRLLTRRGASGDDATWMETYTLTSGTGIDEDMQNLIEERARSLAAWIEGPRHVEAFDRVDDGFCAVPD